MDISSSRAREPGCFQPHEHIVARLFGAELRGKTLGRW
jgi:hypothetical protein